MILQSNLHIDAALTNFSQEYASQRAEFIAEQVAPPLLVQKQTDKYWIHGGESFDLSEVNRAPGTQYGEVTWAKSSDSYSAQGYGLSSFVTPEDLKNADPQIDPGQDAARIIVDQLMLAYEVRVAAMAFSGSVFTQTAALAAADRWNAATSDPLHDVQDAKAAVRAKIGVEPNTMVIGYDVWRALQENAGVRKIVFGLNAPESIPSEAQVAQALGIGRILVGRAVYRSAANTFANVWGKCAFIGYIDPAGGSRSISGLRTFVWGVDGGRYVSRGPIWEDATKSWKYYVDDYTDEKCTSLYAAYLYTTVVD